MLHKNNQPPKSYIEVSTKIVNAEWYKCSKSLGLYIYLAFNASPKKTHFLGEFFNAGSAILDKTEIKKLFKISDEDLNIYLNKLKKSGDIILNVTTDKPVYTTLNYVRFNTEGAVK